MSSKIICKFYQSKIIVSSLFFQIYGCVPWPTQTADDYNDGDDDVYATGILFAPKDVEEFSYTPKDDLHGLGYKGIDVSSALTQNTREDRLGVGVTRNYFGKVKGIKGQASIACCCTGCEIKVFVRPSKIKKLVSVPT